MIYLGIIFLVIVALFIGCVVAAPMTDCFEDYCSFNAPPEEDECTNTRTSSSAEAPGP